MKTKLQTILKQHKPMPKNSRNKNPQGRQVSLDATEQEYHIAPPQMQEPELEILYFI